MGDIRVALAGSAPRLGVGVMHRWITRLVALWLTFFVPSLIIWGLIVRWSDTGPRRFERVWGWLAHLLTFPLALDPLTSRSWVWLATGPAFLAVFGFIILIVIWCLMIALPISIVLSWADWLGHRLTPPHATAYSAGYMTDDMYGESGSVSHPAASSALNLLYAITIPIAICWHMLRWFLRTFRAAIITFVLFWLFFFVAYIIATYRTNPYQWPTQLMELNDAWNGYLNKLGFHHLFGPVWNHNFNLTVQLANTAHVHHEVWDQVTGDLTNFPFILKLYAVFATMHAMLAASVVGAITTLGNLFRHL